MNNKDNQIIITVMMLVIEWMIMIMTERMVMVISDTHHCLRMKWVI